MEAFRPAGGDCETGKNRIFGWVRDEPFWPNSMSEAGWTGVNALSMAVLHLPKRGECVGKTKRGKGTKWMVVVDGRGIPLGNHLDSASPAEVKLVERTLKTIAVPRQGPGAPKQKPERLIADRGYDSDSLRKQLARRGIELICPHRTRCRKKPIQDGRKFRRYRRRYKVERTFAWLGNCRRLVVRYDRNITIYRAFFHIACLIITLRRL
ncbi:MAG TPA: IS5 family transposase [Anaerohalosphaeraceae bacterium]|nr:IS5 family transposase [Anaerohalosphaeraceae bacterium]